MVMLNIWFLLDAMLRSIFPVSFLVISNCQKEETVALTKSQLIGRNTMSIVRSNRKYQTEIKLICNEDELG
jgi:hypothetical protein